MAVGPDTVARMAALAALDVPTDRLEQLAADLSAMLGYVDQLGALGDLDDGPEGGFSGEALPRRADRAGTGAGE